MSELRLGLLGPPVVEREGRPVTFDTRKALALLALLAVNGGEQSRTRLASTLWPDSDDFKARAALRRTISVTAAAMGGALVVSRQSVRLDPMVVQVDVHDFARLVASQDGAALERAVRLYRDDFMSGFGLRDSADFDDWQAETSEHFRQLLSSALETLVRLRAAAGDLPAALDHARRWLSLDPLHEPAHQELIRLYGWMGQRSAALKQYRACVGVLDQELGVAPLPRTTELYEEVLAGSPALAHPELSATPALSAEPARREGRATAVPPFVDRVAELAALLTSWRRVGAAGQLVALSGEPGSGKTFLISRFCQSVAQEGGTVVVARGHDGESGVPYIVLADLLRAAAAAHPRLAQVLPRSVALEVGRLVPQLAPPDRDATSAVAGPAGLTRLFAAIAATLRVAFPPTGGVVVLEDLQAVDPRSLDVLTYLVHRLFELPLLLLVSWSAENAERIRGLRVAVAEAVDEGRAEVIELQPFGEEQVQELFGAIGAPIDDLPRLVDETRGLPLLVRAYGDALIQGDGSAGLPASARDVLSRRLTAVGQPAAQLVSAAAVLGRGFDADLLRAVSGRGENEVVDGLESALARGLLVEGTAGPVSRGPTYDFPYEALRRVAYDSTSAARRRLVHGRAADVLMRRFERDPGSIRAATVADHLQRAGRETEATEWWWLAAERARTLYAHAEALAHISQARALGYPELPALLASGDVLVTLGRYGEALESFEAAAARVEPDDPALAEIEHRLADVNHRLGEWALAASHLRAADELLPEGDKTRRARLEGDQALVAYRRGDLAEAAKLGEGALKLAGQIEDGRALAQATNVLGVLAARAGDPTGAESLLRQSLEHALELGDPGPAVAALNNLSRLLAEQGRREEARDASERALELGKEQGDRHRVAALHTNLADILQASGQHDAALEHLKESARLFAGVDSAGPIRPEIWALVEW
ncbi:MAG: tetratricopeptide repeat protein [Candidatus Dormiibacterota bacterium]